MSPASSSSVAALVPPSPAVAPARARADRLAYVLALAAAIVVKAGLLPVVPW